MRLEVLVALGGLCWPSDVSRCAGVQMQQTERKFWSRGACQRKREMGGKVTVAERAKTAAEWQNGIPPARV